MTWSRIQKKYPKTMKYGILTFHNIPNIGALLQGLALCKSYRKMGIDCDIIDYTCDNIVQRELTYHQAGNPLKNIVSKFLLWPKAEKKIKACQQYMRAQNVYSANMYDRASIKSANQDYDAFISGSDMIWNLDVTGRDFSFFLDFVEDNKKRIACGSSIGSAWSESEKPIIKEHLQKYEAIAVREADTCDIIKGLGVECQHICDPTMLIEPNEWAEQAILPKDKGYVLVYFGYPLILKSAKEYAKKHGLKLVLMNWGLPKLGQKVVGPNTPPEWMGYFKNASAVFTDSYHGLLFSLYFKTPVWTANTGNRIKSLLESLNLTNCFVQNDPSYENKIEYEACHEGLRKMREHSLNYIKHTIELCNK